VYSDDENWNGATLYYSIDEEQNYNVLKYTETETSVGKLISISQKNLISPNLIDINTEIVFSLFDENGKLQSLADEDFSQMKYKILIGDEIISFRDVEIVDKNIFKIKYLLRGRFNTEEFISSHKIGERVILLDNDLISVELPITQRGKNIYLKATSNGESLMNVEAKKLVPLGLSVCDFDVKNINKTMLANGDILFSFSTRKKYKLNNTSGLILTNNLRLKVLTKNGEIKRQVKLANAISFVYSVSDQIDDFGRQIDIKEIEAVVENIMVI
jgi:hypothetical protein